MLQPIGDNWRVFVELQIGGQKYFEKIGSAIHSGWVDQHIIEWPSAIGRVDIFHLPHADRIQCGRQNVLAKSICRPTCKTPIRSSEPYKDVNKKTGKTISFRIDGSHVQI